MSALIPKPIVPTAPKLKYPQRLKKAHFSLYGDQTIQFGNNISFSHRKTRRTWIPNVVTKGFDSKILQQELKIRVTTKVFRMIERAGGIDNYLLFSRPADINSVLGVNLRNTMIAEWEKVNGKKFDAREINFQQQLQGKKSKLREGEYWIVKHVTEKK